MDHQIEELAEEALSFGPFQLFRQQRVLVENGRRLRLGGRAMDILIALVERAGQVVGKRELMALAWPHSLVNESNLRIHIVALRKALGDDQGASRYIINVSGRGYIFSANVTRCDPNARPPAPEERAATFLAKGLKPILGRAAAVDVIVEQFATRRLISVVGPGGVGKSTIAQLVAEAGSHLGRHGVHHVELSSIDDPAHVTAALATAMGMSAATHDPMASLIAFLQDQQALIVLDNCEHVIDAAAVLVEGLLSHAPGVRVLATSREPLLANGEWVYRLKPLAAPEDILGLTAADAMTYPAVQLFMARAAYGDETLRFGDVEILAAAEICRRLDGLPLAIELAAARVDLFGVGGLATALNDRLILAARQSRTGSPRQQSIRGALDWSYDLLSAQEQRVLRRFSVFRGAFSLESAAAVAADETLPVAQVLDAIASLTAKSLVVTDTSGEALLYRLLRVTRAYAQEKLADSGEAESLARRHAEHHRALLTEAETRWETLTRTDWLKAYGYTIDDVRVALDWAFGPKGDIGVGAALTNASLPFGFQLCLIDEFKRRAELALGQLQALDPPNPLAELRLNGALAVLHLNASIDRASMEAVFERSVTLSDRIGVAKYKVEPLLARAIYRLEMGDHAGAVEMVGQLSDSAVQADDPLAILLAERAAAQVYHQAGDQARARTLAQRVLRHPAKVIPLAYSQASIDRRVSMRIVQARILWLDGLADQAVALMSEAMDLAYLDGPFTACYSLAMGACPIALWTGDLVAARAYADELVESAKRFTLDRWGRLGQGYKAMLDHPEPRPAIAPNPLLEAGVEPASPMQLQMLVTINERVITQDLAVAARAGLCGWCNPEMLRATGERMLASQTSCPTLQPSAWLQNALDDAQARAAPAWALRAATSLARYWRRQSQPAQGAAVLAPVLAQFTEGFETADLRSATALLHQLETASEDRA